MKTKYQSFWMQLFMFGIVFTVILAACGPRTTPSPTNTTAPQPMASPQPTATATLPPTETKLPATSILVATATLTSLPTLPPPATPTLPVPPTITPIPATSTPNAVTACDGAPAILHKIGETVMVNTDPPEPNSLRSGPGKKTEWAGSIQPGEMANIVGGPVCADNYTWWQVETELGLSGWTAEGDKSNYWLIDLPNEDSDSCNAPSPRVTVGQKVMISLDPPISQFLLKMPGKHRPIIAGLEIGTPLTIIGGNACMDGYIYWQVMTEDGLIGWTAEGDREKLWLVDVVPGTSISCVNSPAPRLAPYKRGAVANNTDLNNVVREEPNRASQSLGQLPPGTSFFVNTGPVCGDGYYWWNIVAENGLIGWTPEGDAAGYWLTPVHEVARSGNMYYLQMLDTAYIMQFDLLKENPVIKTIAKPEQITLSDKTTIITYPRSEDLTPTHTRWLEDNSVAFVLQKPVLTNLDELEKKTSTQPEFEVRDALVQLQMDGTYAELFHVNSTEEFIIDYGWVDGLIVETMDTDGKFWYYRVLPGSEPVAVDPIDLDEVNVNPVNLAGTYKYETCAHESEHLSGYLYLCLNRQSNGQNIQIAGLQDAGPGYYGLWLDDDHLLIWEWQQGKMYVALTSGEMVRLVADLGIPQSKPKLLPDGKRVLLNYDNGIYLASVEDLLQFIYNYEWIANGVAPYFFEAK
jgi:uncharacterized protein YgiM (DUF1202 family)